MIEWRDVQVSFGGPPVVGPLTLAVGDGEWVGIIGPNGAGKSSLLKAAVGVVEHEGSVALGGRRSQAGRDIAWMPQRPQLPEEMTVADYVFLGRTPHLGRFASERPADLESVRLSIDRLDLGSLHDRKLGTLSGGEAQRAVLARAMAQGAPVLLLDEPTSNLDIGHALEVLETLDALRRQDGLTVVTAVHDLTLAGRFSDRLVLLAGGGLVADGAPAEVLTERNLHAHYGEGVRVIDDGQGPAVIPVRRPHA